MKLRLSWTDPESQRPRQPILDAPIALGQAFEAMPKEISGKSVSRMVISDRQAHGFQALLVEIEGRVYLIGNSGQTYVNQHPVDGQAPLNSGDRICIGQTELQFQILEASQPGGSQQTTHLQALPAPAVEQPPEAFVQNGQPSPSSHSSPHKPLLSPTQAPPPLQPPSLPVQAPQPATHQPPIPAPQPSQASQPAAHQQPIQAPQSIQTRQPTQHQQPVQHQQTPPVSEAERIEPMVNGQLVNGYQPVHNLAEQYPHSTLSPTPHISTPVTPASQAPVAGSHPGSGCRRIVGFLFKRPCGRSNNTGCNYCTKGGGYSSQAFSADYKLYEGFGRYELGDWGYGLLANQQNDETQ